MTAACWAGVLLASDLPIILARAGGDATPAWVTPLQLGGLAALWLASRPRPAGGLLLALLAFRLGWSVLLPALLAHPAYESWRQSASPGVRGVVGVAMPAAVTALMALTLAGSGLGRRELRLRVGELNAPAAAVSSLARVRRPVGWAAFALAFLAMDVALAAYQFWSLRPGPGAFDRLAAAWWAVPAAAAVNAANEEFQFRVVPLARGERAAGPHHAVWMSAALFGLAHWYGQPSGLAGVAICVGYGWMAAVCIRETGGVFWAWLLHFAGDVAIYAVLVMKRGEFTVLPA